MVHPYKLVPQIYRESRDFKVFLKLISLVVNSCKYDIDNWIDLYDPLKCPDSFLPALSDMIGYRYDNSLSVKENRIIMSEFGTMIKNKGSEIGLRRAAALSMNAQLASDPESEEYKHAVDQLQFLDLSFDYETGTITLFYPKDLTKIRDIFKYVRPVGTKLKLILTDFPEPESDYAISARVTVEKHDFNASEYTGNRFNSANVNLTQINRGDMTDSNNLYRPVGRFSVDTVRELGEIIKNGSYDESYDLNGDGICDFKDLRIMKQILLGIIDPNDLDIEV